MIASQDQIRVTAETAHRDYVLTDYEPVVSPVGRLQPVSLFRHALRGAGWLEAVWPICEVLRQAVGPDRTVWALKFGADGLGVEFYLYNNQANDPVGPLSIAPVADALAPLGAFPQRCEERIPYFMWSFEVTIQGLLAGRFSPIRLYLDTGETLREPGGFSYRLEGGAAILENHYSFYKPDTELEDARRRLARSPRSGRPSAWRGLMPVWLCDCHTICYAVKPRRDGLYFARLQTAPLARFLRRVHKRELSAVLDAHAHDFAHCVWDLGFDFAMPEDATRPAIQKMAIHGVL
ncbi:MAG: hypothetical protein AAFV53_06170 [Myxococcota bacterium]